MFSFPAPFRFSHRLKLKQLLRFAAKEVNSFVFRFLDSKCISLSFDYNHFVHPILCLFISIRMDHRWSEIGFRTIGRFDYLLDNIHLIPFCDWSGKMIAKTSKTITNNQIRSMLYYALFIKTSTGHSKIDDIKVTKQSKKKNRRKKHWTLNIWNSNV